jgi:hypothetical protein
MIAGVPSMQALRRRRPGGSGGRDALLKQGGVAV